MSKLKYVDISSFRPQVDDILIVQNREDINDSMYAKVLEVVSESDTEGKYKVQVMRTTASFIAGTQLNYTLDRTTGPVIGAVIPVDDKEEPGFTPDVSLEEIVLYHILTLARPFAQQGRSVRLKTAVDYLRAHDVVKEAMTDDRVKALIKRAIALRPDKIQLTGGWITQRHIVSNTPATPKNLATTERVVDKQRLLRTVNEFVIGLCESGVLGPISWKVE
jgi:hypothetical protein